MVPDATWIQQLNDVPVMPDWIADAVLARRFEVVLTGELECHFGWVVGGRWSVADGAFFTQP